MSCALPRRFWSTATTCWGDFSWTATADSYNGEIILCRHGWDIVDIDDPDKPRADYSIAGYANAMRDLLAVLDVEDVWQPNRENEAELVLGSTVNKVLREFRYPVLVFT